MLCILILLSISLQYLPSPPTYLPLSSLASVLPPICESDPTLLHPRPPAQAGPRSSPVHVAPAVARARDQRVPVVAEAGLAVLVDEDPLGLPPGCYWFTYVLSLLLLWLLSLACLGSWYRKAASCSSSGHSQFGKSDSRSSSAAMGQK